MGNMQKVIEATINKVYRESDNIYIVRCSPYEELYLDVRDFNFTNLYNKMKLDQTFKITYYVTGKIMNIEPCDLHYTCGIVSGFLDISIENKIEGDYHQIMIQDDDKKKRLLVNRSEMNDIVIGQTYSVHYQKAFYGPFYRVVKYDHCGY
jgi:hypothetical protein